jgi:hypothetical protein
MTDWGIAYGIKEDELDWFFTEDRMLEMNREDELYVMKKANIRLLEIIFDGIRESLG